MFYPSLHKLHVLCAYSDRINSSLHASTLQALKITKKPKWTAHRPVAAGLSHRSILYLII